MQHGATDGCRRCIDISLVRVWLFFKWSIHKTTIAIALIRGEFYFLLTGGVNKESESESSTCDCCLSASWRHFITSDLSSHPTLTFRVNNYTGVNQSSKHCASLDTRTHAVRKNCSRSVLVLALCCASYCISAVWAIVFAHLSLSSSSSLTSSLSSLFGDFLLLLLLSSPLPLSPHPWLFFTLFTKDWPHSWTVSLSPHL